MSVTSSNQKSRINQDDLGRERLLTKTVEIASTYLDELDNRPPATDYTSKPLLPLPTQGAGAEAALDLFLQRYGNELPASNGPRFWGFVTGGTTPASLMGDWLTSVYDLNLSAAANSNAPDIEFETIRMLRELFRLPDEFSGTFVTGATMSNFVGLAIGREWASRQLGQSAAEDGLHAIGPIHVVSGEVHSSVLKAMSMLGLGRRNYLPVATQPNAREAVDIEALRQTLKQQQGRPCLVVANAGTVNTVDHDDLLAIAGLRDEYDFWLHVDAAFGGFAACSKRYQNRVSGMELADSITIDAHKWLNTPYDGAMVFTRHRDLQIDVFQNSAAYLGELSEPVDFVHLSPENSRRMRALPIWFTLMAYGRQGVGEIVERNCALAGELGKRVDASEHFTLLAPVHMNVVCFTLTSTLSESNDSGTIGAYLARLRDDGRVFLTPTVFKGVPAIRAAISNWRTEPEDVEIAWQAIVECLRNPAS